VAAAGKAQMIKGDMVKDGVVVIDVGTNRLGSGKLVGDVDFATVSEKASYITPVPVESVNDSGNAFEKTR